MPIVGLGTWKSKPGEVVAAVKYALQIGYRHLDCAFVYGNENEVGQGIKEAMEEFSIPRKDIWITSKLWSAFHHPEEIENACKMSLKNLGLDYLDLYLMHWPTAFKRGEGNFPKNEDGTIKVSFNLENCTSIAYCYFKLAANVYILIMCLSRKGTSIAYCQSQEDF